MASSSVRETFDQLAGEYDALKLRVIPGYREVQVLVDRYAEVPDQSPARVLELGFGTGDWAERLLQRYLNVAFDGVDFSEQMRNIAGQRLQRFRNRVQLHATDLQEPLPPGPFDRVVSFFAVHHVSDKRRLIGEVAASLVEGGRFLWADITTAGTPALEQLFLDDWVAFMRDAGLEEEEIAQVLRDHRENDLPETVESQVGYLQQAGFDPAAVVWSYGKFVLFFGRR